VKHAITYFNRVRLPSKALLGTLDKDEDQRLAFFKLIHRVPSGAVSVGVIAIVAMRACCYIAGRYSLRRTVTDAFTGKPRAIINFSTQYIPILTAIAQTLVMESFSTFARNLFTEARNDLLRRHVVATIFKASVLQLTLPMPIILGDRCGAQGLHEVNQLSAMHVCRCLLFVFGKL
jgi:acyl-CoA oxidase